MLAKPGLGFRIHYLLDNPEIMAKMGQNAKEFGRENFIIRNLGDYLALMAYLQTRREREKAFAISSIMDETAEGVLAFDTTRTDRDPFKGTERRLRSQQRERK